MRRYIVLLLITGIVWAQTDYDKLVLKNGKEYLGEYVKTEKEKVYFKSQEYIFPLVRHKVQTLQLKDGTFVINNPPRSEWTIKEKAVYDAKKDARKWILYPPAAFSIFVFSIYGTLIIAREEAWESFPATLGISAASLTIPNFFLGALPLGKTENFNSKDKESYKVMYHKEFKKEKLKYIIIGGVLVPFAILIFANYPNDRHSGGGSKSSSTGFPFF